MVLSILQANVHQYVEMEKYMETNLMQEIVIMMLLELVAMVVLLYARLSTDMLAQILLDQHQAVRVLVEMERRQATKDAMIKTLLLETDALQLAQSKLDTTVTT